MPGRGSTTGELLCQDAERIQLFEALFSHTDRLTVMLEYIFRTTVGLVPLEVKVDAAASANCIRPGMDSLRNGCWPPTRLPLHLPKRWPGEGIACYHLSARILPK
jgi:hypothetical protein